MNVGHSDLIKIKGNGGKSKMFSIFNMYSVVLHDIQLN
jgi:hypothetical protein